MSIYTQSRDNNWRNRFTAPVQEIKSDAGLGINRPADKKDMGATNPMPEKKKPDYEETDFFRQMQQGMEKDPTMKKMNDEMMRLTATLRDDVRRGEMPRHIAEKRLREALDDQRYNADLDRKAVQGMMSAEQGGQDG